MHDGADDGDVDEGDVVEVRLVPEFEGVEAPRCVRPVCVR